MDPRLLNINREKVVLSSAISQRNSLLSSDWGDAWSAGVQADGKVRYHAAAYIICVCNGARKRVFRQEYNARGIVWEHATIEDMFWIDIACHDRARVAWNVAMKIAIRRVMALGCTEADVAYMRKAFL